MARKSAQELTAVFAVNGYNGRIPDLLQVLHLLLPPVAGESRAVPAKLFLGHDVHFVGTRYEESMETTKVGSEFITRLTDNDRGKLNRLISKLARHVTLPSSGAWQRRSSEELWHRVVSQVCVMGAASGMEKLESSEQLDSFRDATSLALWQQHGYRHAYMAKQLHQFSATRFHNKAATRLQLIATASDAVHGARVVVYKGLAPARDPDVLRDQLIARFNNHLGRKSVSDYMIETGLSRDVIALDQRVVGFFNEHMGYRPRFNSIQNSHKRYVSVALRGVCGQRGITLGELDRILFRFSGMSAVEFFIRH